MGCTKPLVEPTAGKGLLWGLPDRALEHVYKALAVVFHREHNPRADEASGFPVCPVRGLPANRLEHLV